MKQKHKRKIFVIFILIMAVLAISLYFLDFKKEQVNWGVTFSKNYTVQELGLDWKETYLAILDDLKIDHIRLSAYWNEIEPEQGKYNFSDLDWQINEASKRNVKIVLAVGRRLPRWPECHDPGWLSSSTAEQIKSSQLSMIEKVIRRYQENKNIISWQVENEPYLSYFGVCPQLDENLLKQEISLVKNISSKPVIITDSGELSTWIPAANAGGDYLGTTLYRVVYNEWFGYFKWFLPPAFYTFKSWLISHISPIQKVFVMELQTESWHVANKNLSQMTLEDQFKSLSFDQFKSNIAYAKQAGFSDVYLWGVEWWYYMKTHRNYPNYWDEAKKLWQ